MKNTTSTTEQKELEMNVNGTSKLESGNDQLVEMVPINDTPFTAVKAGEVWFLTMGKYRLTNQLGSLEEAKAEATDASWNRIMQIVQIMIEENQNKLKEANQVLKEQVEQLKNQIH